MENTVRVEQVGPVTIISIDRPERRNAVDATTAIALHAAFKAFDEDETASVAVLTGTKGHFCAGADLQAIASGGGNPMRATGDMGPMGPTRLQLGKPVIAAIEGYAVAGGMELALWCDLRVMAEGATFGVFCRRFGVPLIDMGTVRLPRLIGQSRAMDLILTGRPVDAKEAEAIGLANRICAEGDALKTAVALAHEIAAFPQTCMRNDRRSALDQWSLSTEDAQNHEFELGLKTLKSGETAAGAGAFTRGKGRGGAF
ncbi:MAG: crotonase/enoyl-CoA hydratase family protein [Pseudomonadota bacterium]